MYALNYDTIRYVLKHILYFVAMRYEYIKYIADNCGVKGMILLMNNKII